ncbi:hypothetical protein RB195_023081 [Necator americanus]|uniref:Uncharacterized protein n=1 Tax=Necator americanus TaxID=51031 RepID=A0ABR1EIE7_NECAM
MTGSLNTFTTARRRLRVLKTRRRLTLETLELIRQRGEARAAGNQELKSEFARLCREAIKEDLKERRAEVLAEAAEAGKSIRYARRDFASRKTRVSDSGTQREQPLHREGGWRKSPTTSTLICSTAMSTCFLTIKGKTDMSFQRFSRPKYDILSYR